MSRRRSVAEHYLSEPKDADSVASALWATRLVEVVEKGLLLTRPRVVTVEFVAPPGSAADQGPVYVEEQDLHAAFHAISPRFMTQRVFGAPNQ